LRQHSSHSPERVRATALAQGYWTRRSLGMRRSPAQRERPMPCPDSPTRSPCRSFMPAAVSPLPRSQKLEFNVQVVARFRPPNSLEEEEDSRAYLVHPSGKSIDSADAGYHFELDRAFCENTSQESVYEYVGHPVVCDVLDGYNGTIFAYGQTGSGKTYCMFGPDCPRQGLQGVVPRTAEQVFDHIEASADETTEFTLRCSFLEVYKEQMRDLLDLGNQSLKVKELAQRGLVVHGLTREYVTCVGEVMQVLRTGDRARSVARTRMNEHSSRSHAIFMMQVEQRSAEGTELHGKLTLVDLAGSEKVGKSGCVGQELEEAKKINWSLSALGKVIDALAEQRPHVPYRDSKLTRVLQEALGGNCRTTLLVAVSPLSMHSDETLSSLRFATRAKAVRNHAKVNYMYSADQLYVLVADLQRDLASANRQIRQFTGTLPESHGEKPKEDKRRKRSGDKSEGGGDWARSAEGKIRLRVPLDKLTAVDRDMDEACAIPRSPSCGRQESGATSCGSARSLDSSGTIPETSEELGPDRDDEAWRPLALAARDAMRSMEAALLAQEGALFEAGLLRPETGSNSTTSREGADRSEQTAPASPTGRQAHSASPEAANEGQQLDTTALSERWRALRHAVDARSLHWRLQVERHKTETLKLELEMRKRQMEEREKDLEALSSVAMMVQDGSLDEKVGVWSDSLRRVLVGVRRRSSMCSSSSGAGGSSSSLAGCFGGVEQESTQTSARRIARPLRGGHSARGIGEARPALVSSELCSPKETTSTRTPATASSRPEKFHLPPTCPSGSTRRAEKFADASEAGFGDENVWTQTSCKGLPGHYEGPPSAAGTGESSSVPTSGVMPPRAGNTSELFERFEALQLSHRELEGQMAGLHGDVEDRDRQLASLAAELGARDVRVSALRHEVRVRDALLGHLHEDSLKKAEHKDHEVERLVEQAMLPLTTILSSRQAANAAAVGERSLLAH